MDSPPSPAKSGVAETVSSIYGERFTHRLEAFSDLVFGFSLSLLATRLDVPAKASDIFETTRWGTFVVTFGIICAIWLSHYRIFRHQFVARTPDVIVNFVFLFGIAVLPYTVQTFLRFGAGDATLLYFGDFGLVFTALATLRWRALLQRRGDPDIDIRLREWRGTFRQYLVVLFFISFLVAMNAGVITKDKFFTIVPAALILITLGTRSVVRRLPAFLQ